MNKLVKGLAIATVTLLGANYVLKKVNKLKTQKIDFEEPTDKISDFSTLTGRKYYTLDLTRKESIETEEQEIRGKAL